MDGNPRAPPTDELDGSPSANSQPDRVVRKGIVFLAPIVWNVPILAILYLAFRGTISERAMHLAMLGWASTIPVCSILLAYIPAFQRFIFVPGVDMARQRPSLWGLAIFWLVIVSFGFTAEFLFHG